MSLSDISVFGTVVKSVALLQLQKGKWTQTRLTYDNGTYLFSFSFSFLRPLSFSIAVPKDSTLSSDKQLNLELNENSQSTSFIHFSFELLRP